MFASNLKNMVVFSKDMVNLGKVKDLEFDPAKMKVTNVIVEFPADAAKYVLGKKIVVRHATGSARVLNRKHQRRIKPKTPPERFERRIQEPMKVKAAAIPAAIVNVKNQTNTEIVRIQRSVGESNHNHECTNYVIMTLDGFACSSIRKIGYLLRFIYHEC